MIRRYVTCVCAGVMVMAVTACGGGNNAAEGPPPAAPKPATTVTLLEPAEGAMSGHIDLFRWSPIAGADSYVIKIVALTGNRVVWESEPLTVTETKLPATVALEPEPHSWSVTARKGTEVLAASPTFKFTITP